MEIGTPYYNPAQAAETAKTQRKVWKLHLAGKTQQEIAQTLGMSRDSARRRIRECRGIFPPEHEVEAMKKMVRRMVRETTNHRSIIKKVWQIYRTRLSCEDINVITGRKRGRIGAVKAVVVVKKVPKVPKRMRPSGASVGVLEASTVKPPKAAPKKVTTVTVFEDGTKKIVKKEVRRLKAVRTEKKVKKVGARERGNTCGREVKVKSVEKAVKKVCQRKKST